MIGVLFTCAGQRVDIVSAFGRAGATTVAADADPLAPALYHAHRRRARAARGRPGLHTGAPRARRRAGHPPADPSHRPRPDSFRRPRRAGPGVRPGPPPEVCRTMGDKYLAHLFFVEHDIPSPRSWLPDDVPPDARFPLLVKVREGFGSRHIHRATDADELDFFLRYTPVDSFVQELCLGEEFSIDVFCDGEARCVGAIPRTMIQSKGGESIKGGSLRDRELIEHARKRGGEGGHRRSGEHAVLSRARRVPPRHRRQPALRRGVSAAARGRQPLSGARARAGERRAARAAARRVPRGGRDDTVLLRPVPDGQAAARSSRSPRSCPSRSPSSRARRS